MEHGFKKGDIVVSTDDAYILRSGSEQYDRAVVVQESPLVLVSEYADMRWEASVKPNKLCAMGTAKPEVLANCLSRL
jgi:hypothetical protein